MKKKQNNQAGMSLVELLSVMAILGIALGAAALSLRPMEAPLQTGTLLLEGFFRQARLQAIATTSAYRVSPASSTRLVAETGSSCAATSWEPVSDMELALPYGVSTTSTGWEVCFSSRGISGGNVVVTLVHLSYGSEQVEVLLGGTTRVLP